ncbi:hypothetical protein QUA56_18335 [Microcoleus sp. N3A4]|uniref:hypothetical protein n=1 Tax=Microcoleus sp. N3A4 TaxID=3055379 RepID=UPI002FD0A4D0
MIGVNSLLRKRSPHKFSARLIDAFLPASTLATTKQTVTRAIDLDRKKNWQGLQSQDFATAQTHS